MRSTMQTHLAIVPAYNEAESIGAAVRELCDRAAEFDAVVIDDGSTDNTAGHASAARADVIRLPFNLGIGGAVQAGYQYALEGGYDYAVQVDGDGQHEAREIVRLLDFLRARPDMHMVTGSRFLVVDEHNHRSTRTRRLGIAVFARILSVITGQTVTDPTSGFRMVSRRGIELFARDYPHDYPEVEAVLMIHAHALNSAEVPVRMRERTGGAPSINASRSFYYMVKVLLSIFVGLFRSKPTVRHGDEAPVTAEPSL